MTTSRFPNIKQIFNIFDKIYPNATTALHFSNPFELLIATILSAQCTDERVNKITESLFKKYKKPEDYAIAELHKLEEDIKSTGFFRNKAKNIKECGKKIIKEFNNNVPATLEELITLPGVARKTANVVLGNAFGIQEGIVVDTHVSRVSQRLGITSNSDPYKIELDLMKVTPKNKWTLFSNQVILHGRKYCMARKPSCNDCPISKYCIAFKNIYRNIDKKVSRET